MKKKTLHYNIMLRPEPEGGFTVTVPALPGCISYGKTLEESFANAALALTDIITDPKKIEANIKKTIAN